MSIPAHIKLIGEEVNDEVAKEVVEPKTQKLSKKQSAQKATRSNKGAVGGGVEN
jgi:hypothetical protein